MSSDPYLDSLDADLKISAHPQSLIKDKKLTSEDLEISPDGLRKKFIASLQKLTQQSTQVNGIKQIQQLVQSFRNQECLKIYLSILKGLKKKPSNSFTMEAELVVIGYICRMYGQKLIDPSDKPPSLLKTVFKVIQLVQTYFIDNTEGVQESASKTLIQIQKYVLKNQTVQHQVSVIFLPLVTMISTGIERSCQQSACFCIVKLIEYWKSSSQPQFIKRVQNDLLQLVIKLNSEFCDLLNSISICLEISGIQFMDQRLQSFINKMIGYLQQPANQPSLYQSKVLACKILEQLSYLLKDSSLLKTIKPLEVLSQLQKVCKSRLIPIQSASTSSYKAWRKLLNLEDFSIIIDKPRTPLMGTLKQIRQKYKQDKSKQKSQDKKKQVRMKLEQQLNEVQKGLQQSSKDRWNASKGKDYIKKGTGIGGGQTGKFISPTEGKNKSFQNQMKQIKKCIEQPKSPKKQTKNQQKSKISAKTNDQKVRINQVKYDLKQPKENVKKYRYQNNNSFGHKQGQQHEFTLQPQYGDQSLDFSLSKSNQNQVLKVQKKAPTNNPQKKIQGNQIGKESNNQPGSQAYLFSKQQIEQIISSQVFSEMSSNLDGILSSNDFANPSELDMMDSNLNDSADIQLINQNKRKRQTLRNTAEKFMKKSRMDSESSFGNSQIERDIDESIELQLSKIRESQNRQVVTVKNVPQKAFERKNQAARFNTLKQEKQEHSQQEEVVSQFEESFQPPLKTIDTPTRIQKQIKKDIITPVTRKQISISKQINLQIKGLQKRYPQQQTKPEFFQKPVAENKKNIQKFQSKQQEQSKQEKLKNYQNIIERPPTSSDPFFKTSDEKSLSRVPSKLSDQQRPSDEGLLDEWKQILVLSQNQQIQEAYQRVLQLDDFIYFLRLLITTGPCFQQMTTSTAKRVLNKVVEIHSTNFFQILIIGMLGQAADLQIIEKSFNIQEVGVLQKYLYELSGKSVGKLSYSTAMLYNQIDKQLKS